MRRGTHEAVVYGTATAIAVVFALLVAWVLLHGENLDKRTRACEARGGVYVMAADRHAVCIRGEVIDS